VFSPMILDSHSGALDSKFRSRRNLHRELGLTSQSCSLPSPASWAIPRDSITQLGTPSKTPQLIIASLKVFLLSPSMAASSLMQANSPATTPRSAVASQLQSRRSPPRISARSPSTTSRPGWTVNAAALSSRLRSPSASARSHRRVRASCTSESANHERGRGKRCKASRSPCRSRWPRRGKTPRSSRRSSWKRSAKRCPKVCRCCKRYTRTTRSRRMRWIAWMR